MRLDGSLWHFVVTILHIPGTSFCMVTQSKVKVGKSQSLCASVAAFVADMEVCGVVQKKYRAGDSWQDMEERGRVETAEVRACRPRCQ